MAAPGQASIPIAEELNLVPYTRGGHVRADAQDSAQLFSNGVSLLRRENHPSVLSPGVGKFFVEPMEVRDVERV